MSAAAAPGTNGPAASASSSSASHASTAHAKKEVSALRTNLSYLVNPKTAEVAPRSLATRSVLRSTRYLLKFVFWRLVRYFKYAAVAAGTAALAGTALGTALPWIAALAVPSIPMAAAMGLGTAVVKFGWRHRGNHFRQSWAAGDGDARKDEEMDANDAQQERVDRRQKRAERAWSNETFT